MPVAATARFVAPRAITARSSSSGLGGFRVQGLGLRLGLKL